MIITSMNVCGLGESAKQNSIMPFILSQSNILLLQETHFKNEDQIDSLKQQFGINCMAHTSSVGNYSGAIIEKSHENYIDQYSYQEIGIHNCIQICSITYGGMKIGIINVHAPHIYRDFKVFAGNLEKAIQVYWDRHLPMLIIGDFNLVYRNPRISDQSKRNMLSAIFNRYDILFPTHLDHGHTRISGYQIDLVFASQCLIGKIVKLETIFTVHSDHAVVKIFLENKQVPQQKMWKLNKDLLEHAETKLFVERRMNMMQNTSLTINEWYRFKKIVKNKYHSRGIIEAKRKREKLQRLQSLFNNACHSLPVNKQQVTRYGNQIKEYEKVEYEAARIRAKQQWIEEGEQPTKYFLGLEKTRATQGSMTAIIKNDTMLQSTGQVTLDPLEIQIEVKRFYEHLYNHRATTETTQSEYLRFVPTLTEEHKKALGRPIDIQEVKVAIMATGGEKSPGIDGLTYEFYKTFIDNVSPMLATIYNNLPSTNQLPNDFGMSLVTLLFKKGDPKDITNWRPISLQNTDEKILSKVLATRLAIISAQVLGKEQSGFIPGRETSDVILHSQCVQRLLTKKKRGGYIAMIDFEKAYDSVDHAFLLKILRKMDGSLFTDLIEVLYNQPRLRVKCNGTYTAPIEMKRGVRQGCPVSPLLFNLVINCFIERIKDDKEFIGIKIGSVQTKIKNFADDTNIFLGNQNDLEILMKHLKSFEDATGLRINIGKSKILAIGTQSFTINPSPFGLELKNAQMLGVPVGNNVKAAEIWEPMLERIDKMATHWKKRKLTLIGKAIVVNSLLLSQLWYRASIFKIPKKYRGRLKKIIKKFLFNDRPAWTTKKVWYAPKEKGGLGILPIKTQNNALLAKIAYKMHLPIETRPQWCDLAKIELGRLGTDSLNGNIVTRMESHSPYWKDLKLIWNKFVHYEAYKTNTAQQLLDIPTTVYRNSGPDLYVGDLFTTKHLRCFRCGYRQRRWNSTPVSDIVYNDIQMELKSTLARAGVDEECRCQRAERKDFEPYSLAKWTLNGESFKYSARLARACRQKTKWPTLIYHEHWQPGVITQYLPLLTKIMKSSSRMENKIKCLRWKLRHNMVPRNYSKTLECSFCQESVDSMEHIWLDCRYSEEIYKRLDLPLRFGRDYARIFGCYDKKDKLLGIIQLTIWNHFWHVHFGDCRLLSTRGLERQIQSRQC